MSDKETESDTKPGWTLARDVGESPMKPAGVFLGYVLVFVVRGMLLWLVLPAAAVAWVLMVLPLMLARLVGRDVQLSPRFFLRWGTQFVDACITRCTPRSPVGPEPWPWKEPPTVSGSTGVVDML